MIIYLQLFLEFLKIGLFTIGGGYAMIPVIQQTVVTDMGWISQELFINFIGVSESTPGPFAVNIATFVGYETGGILGGIAAVGGLFAPAFIIMLVIYKFSASLMKKNAVKDALSGIQPTVVALIFSAFVTVAISALTYTEPAEFGSNFNWFGLILFAASFAALRFVKKLHPIFIIVISAGLGILFYGFIL